MIMTADIQSYPRLVEIQEIERKYGSDVPEGISASSAHAFRAKFSTMFGFCADETHVGFLTLVNGLDVNGYRIYGADEGRIESVFSANAIWRENGESEDIVFLAESGQDLFVFKDQQYAVLDRYAGDETGLFNSFEEMVNYIFDRILD